MELNSEQFPVDYPYPRLRESYARRWAIESIKTAGGDPSKVAPTSELAHGRHFAKSFVAMHFAFPNNESGAKDELIEKGFRQRKDTKRQYSSWFN